MCFSTPVNIGSALPLHVGTFKATRGQKKVQMEKAVPICNFTHAGRHVCKQDITTAQWHLKTQYK